MINAIQNPGPCHRMQNTIINQKYKKKLFDLKTNLGHQKNLLSIIKFNQIISDYVKNIHLTIINIKYK